MSVVHVLQHDYYEGLGTIHRVYIDKARAEKDLELVKLHDGGRWQLHEVELIDPENAAQIGVERV